MAATPIPPDKLQEAVNAVARYGTAHSAAKALGLATGTIQHRYDRGIAEGYKPQVDAIPPEPPPEPPDYYTAIRTALKQGGHTLDQLSSLLGLPPAACRGLLLDLKEQGANVHEIGGLWSIESAVQPAYVNSDLPVYESRPDNTYLFGACGDKHLGSKYHRADVLESLYTEYQRAGVDRVFDTGNWVDGEARFNRYDLHVHGMDAQMAYLAKHHPRKPGIVTYAVSGDDHEGWYAQREGINVGKYCENKFREAGRDDWIDLGYMEAHIRLRNTNTGAESILAVAHPGGGSSYAISYSIQKIIESLDGGEKPAVRLDGHYHKLWFGNIRNVWCVQTGTCQDQTPFGRKKKLDFHVGGTIVKLTQDPETGAIVRCQVEILRYFNKGYYNNRWSHANDVSLPPRVMGKA